MFVFCNFCPDHTSNPAFPQMVVRAKIKLSILQMEKPNKKRQYSQKKHLIDLVLHLKAYMKCLGEGQCKRQQRQPGGLEVSCAYQLDPLQLLRLLVAKVLPLLLRGWRAAVETTQRLQWREVGTNAYNKVRWTIMFFGSVQKGGNMSVGRPGKDNDDDDNKGKPQPGNNNCQKHLHFSLLFG